MGPIWGRQDPGGPHVGPMNFAIWDIVRAMMCLLPFGTGKFYLPEYTVLRFHLTWIRVIVGFIMIHD